MHYKPILYTGLFALLALLYGNRTKAGLSDPGSMFPDTLSASHSRPWGLHLLAGYNIGATAPLSLSPSIRKIHSWWPTFNPSIGIECVRAADRKLTVAAALKLEYKGAGIRSRVKHFPTTVTIKDAHSENTFEGVFTGENKTVIHNAYLTIPVYGIYKINSRVHFRFGMYAAIRLYGKFEGEVSDGYIRKGDALGEKVMISSADFDFSGEQHAVDYGLLVGISKQIHKKIFIYADLTGGFVSLFPESFRAVDMKLYQIHLQMGAGWNVLR